MIKLLSADDKQNPLPARLAVAVFAQMVYLAQEAGTFAKS
ncbi:hypothetical protein CES85_3833 [Ochrobactrum quorumnocens]|uniref:Uncharacterized protein n=1 Tax=Ochrobactrum quorumnocens TaxID=271865 RepID=A0A248U8N6_9HYPH|nr:hypothetical protein CES85_3833 [[Ochrobactrum] quorumnocens]